MPAILAALTIAFAVVIFPKPSLASLSGGELTEFSGAKQLRHAKRKKARRHRHRHYRFHRVKRVRPVIPLPRARSAMEESVPQSPIVEADKADIFRRYEASMVKPAHEAVRMACPGDKPLPQPLRELLADAARYFAANVFVNSAYRSRAHNRRVRGVRRSQHVACRAVDFHVAGVPAAQLFEWTSARREIKGLGRYAGSNFIHADIRDSARRITWCWGCGRKRPVRLAARH